MAGVQIVECTPGSEGWCAVLAHAVVALFGNATCSGRNTRESCFAAEWCDRNVRPAAPFTFVSDLMTSNTCYAAIDVVTRGFLGVVALGRDDAMLHCLCVVHGARGRRGVGRALVDHVIRSHGHRRRLQLTVAAPTSTGHAADVLRDRHDRLVSFYESRGFRRTGRVRDGYTHMVRREGRGSL